MKKLLLILLPLLALVSVPLRADITPRADVAKSEGKWPCDQVYTEKLSISTVWQGGELGDRLKTWWEDDAVIEEVSVLLNPILDEEAIGEEVTRFAAAQPQAERKEKLLRLFAGLYSRTVEKRVGQLRSILRFAARQEQLTEAISAQADELREMRRVETPMDDPNYTALQTELDWYARIFDERLNLTEYICEEPVLLTQRLGFASRAIGKALAN